MRSFNNYTLLNSNGKSEEGTWKDYQKRDTGPRKSKQGHSRSNKIYQTNNKHIREFGRKIEKSTNFQSETIRIVINLSKHKFSKAT